MKNATRRLGRWLVERTTAQHESPMAASLTRAVSWKTGTTAPTGEIYEMFGRTEGAHKWHHYFEVYGEIFAALRSRPVRILEIGVYKGASIKVWSEYFHPESVLVGVDINPECAAFDQCRPNVNIRIGSQADGEFLARVVEEFGPFDLIIDDGSHVSSHMIASFNALFEKGLKEGGTYFVEDTHTMFWSDYQDSDVSFFEFSHLVVDSMHAHYKGLAREENFRVSGQPLEFSVPLLTTLIHEVRFFDSVIVFQKKKRPAPQSQHW